MRTHAYRPIGRARTPAAHAAVKGAADGKILGQPDARLNQADHAEARRATNPAIRLRCGKFLIGLTPCPESRASYEAPVDKSMGPGDGAAQGRYIRRRARIVFPARVGSAAPGMPTRPPTGSRIAPNPY